MEGNVWNRNKRRNRYQRSWNASDTEQVYVRDRFVAPSLPWWRTSRFLSIVLAIVLVGWGVLLLWHPYFFLRHITVEASETRNAQQYQDAVVQATRGTGALSLRGNYFLFSTASLENTLRQKFPLQSLTIEKHFPNTLQVRLVEKSDSIVALDGTRIVRVTTQGVVTPITTIAQKVGEGSTSSTTSTVSSPVAVNARAQLLSESKKLGVPAVVFRSWSGAASASPITPSFFTKLIDFTTLTKTTDFLEKGGIPQSELQYLVYDPVHDPYSLGYVLLDSRRGGSEITFWYDVRTSFESQNEMLFAFQQLEKTTSYRQLDLRRPGEVILVK